MDDSVDFTHLEVANRALADVRARPLRDFDAEDERTMAIVAGYWSMVDHLLTCRKWHFCRLWSKLQPWTASEADRRGWDYAHLLPQDRIGPPILLVRDPLDEQGIRRFEFSDNADKVFSQEEQLWALTPRRAAPQLWPAYFRMLAVKALAATFALTVRNNEGLAASRTAEAFGTSSIFGHGGLMKTASDLDHAMRPPEELTAGRAFTNPRQSISNTDGTYYMKL